MKRIVVAILFIVIAGAAVYFLTKATSSQQHETSDNSPEVAEAKTAGSANVPSGQGAPARRMLPEISEDDDPVGILRLEGQVIDTGDLPVDGAIVAINTRPPRTARTEKDGTFFFDKLVGRRFSLTARHGKRVGGPILHKLSEKSDPVVIRLRSGATVEVSVTAAGRGAPVAGALLELRTIDNVPAVTDAQGQASFTGVAAGYCTLSARASGFSPAQQLVSVPESSTKPIHVALSLRRGSGVSGNVVDQDGRPVQGARVLAVDSSALLSLANADRDGATSDKEGRFTIDALAPGSYRLEATHSDYPAASSKPVRVSSARPTPDVTIVMQPGAVMSGMVVDDGGRAVPWARVRCGRKDSNPLAGGAIGGRRQRGTTADEQGKFSIKGLPRAEMQVLAQGEQASSDPLTVDLRSKTVVDDIVLRLTVTGTIAGQVHTPSGDPLADIEVAAFPDIWSNGISSATFLRGRSTTVTDGGGHFVLRGLSQGSYRLRASRSAGSFRARMNAGVKARTGDENVEIVLGNDGGIKGRLVFAEGGNPVEFSLALNIPPGIPVTSQDGSFEIPGIAPGSYRLTIRGSNFAETVVPQVSVEEDKVTDLGTIKVRRGRTLTGRVMTEDGSPVPGATVLAATRLVGDGSHLALDLGKAAEEQMGLHRAVSDADGFFRIEGLSQERYMLVAEKEEFGRSDAMVVPQGTTGLDQELVLHASAGVFGTVTAGGEPAAGAIIQANPVGESAKVIVVHAGDDGGYTIDKIQAGQLRITAAQLAGAGLGARSEGIVVTARAGEKVRADIDIPVGNVNLTVDVKGQGGAKIDAAQVLLLAGKVQIETAAELNKVAMAGGGSISQTFWTVAKPAVFNKVIPAEYSLCVIPINGDMNDPAFLMRLRKNTATLKVICSPLTVPAQPESQRQQVVVPPMQPLPPEPAPETQ